MSRPYYNQQGYPPQLRTGSASPYPPSPAPPQQYQAYAPSVPPNKPAPSPSPVSPTYSGYPSQSPAPQSYSPAPYGSAPPPPQGYPQAPPYGSDPYGPPQGYGQPPQGYGRPPPPSPHGSSTRSAPGPEYPSQPSSHVHSHPLVSPCRVPFMVDQDILRRMHLIPVVPRVLHSKEHLDRDLKVLPMVLQEAHLPLPEPLSSR
ncbi:hypothetical protein BDV35DRAFT_19307 [Aspergillus flavus]|uniref:Uncharacterized protein n=1 Tax=Aspergillus flavus TaxID=5059 RepID=A0A5N6GK81_ASPFL|nr:hypothetical protein BDV35DRAFT_19307 [Aspergillus flavus]